MIITIGRQSGSGGKKIGEMLAEKLGVKCYDKELLAMTIHGFRIYSLAYLINGFNIFGSSFFAALNNGVISAVISFMRTLVFQIGAILILPIFLDINGIWSAIIVAEALTLCVTLLFIIRKKNYYHYC